MKRRAKVELFEQIRREYEFGGGTIKGDCPQAGGTSPDGAPGAGGCTAAGAQADRTRAAGGGAADSLYRRHPGSRPQIAAQAAPHRASHFRADFGGAAGAKSGGSDDPPVRAGAQTGAGLVRRA